MNHEQNIFNFQNIYSKKVAKTVNISEFCLTETQKGQKNLCRSDKAVTSISTSTCEQHSHWSFWTEPIDWLSPRNGAQATPCFVYSWKPCDSLENCWSCKTDNVRQFHSKMIQQLFCSSLFCHLAENERYFYTEANAKHFQGSIQVMNSEPWRKAYSLWGFTVYPNSFENAGPFKAHCYSK